MPTILLRNWLFSSVIKDTPVQSLKFPQKESSHWGLSKMTKQDWNYQAWQYCQNWQIGQKWKIRKIKSGRNWKLYKIEHQIKLKIGQKIKIGLWSVDKIKIGQDWKLKIGQNWTMARIENQTKLKSG